MAIQTGGHRAGICQQEAELDKEVKITGIPVIFAKQGLETYACIELVYDYATWISPAFKVEVFRTFHSVKTGAQAAFTQAITEETGKSPKDWYESQLIDQEKPLPQNGEVGNGRPSSFDNIKPTQGGTSADYTRKRLKRDRPDLLERVAEGEMSLNAAAIEAGFRKVKTPLEQVMALIPKLTEEERQEVLEYLTAGE
jgi:KilA-N domain